MADGQDQQQFGYADAGQVTTAPPKSAAPSPAPSGQFETADASQVTTTPPQPDVDALRQKQAAFNAAQPKGFDEQHPYLAKAEDFLNNRVNTPVREALASGAQSFYDIPKVFTTPRDLNESVNPITGNLSPNPDEQDLSFLARRAGRLGKDILGWGSEPFSVATAPAQPVIQKAIPTLQGGTPEMNELANTAAQLMIFDALGKGAPTKPAPLETELPKGAATLDRSKAASEPVVEGQTAQDKLAALQKKTQTAVANTSGQQGMEALEQRLADRAKEVRQQEAKVSREAQINEILQKAQERGKVPVTDTRTVQPTAEELEQPNVSQETKQPRPVEDITKGLPQPPEMRVGPTVPVEQRLQRVKEVTEGTPESKVPPGAVLPLGESAPAQETISRLREGKPVQGIRAAIPSFGAPEEKSASADNEESQRTETFHPLLQRVVDKYGSDAKPSDTRNGASFINPDGSITNLGAKDHPQVISDVDTKGNYKGSEDARVPFINDTGAIRTNFTKQSSGDHLAISVPKWGVTPEQVDSIKQAVAKGLGRYGNLTIETANRPNDIKFQTKEFASPSDVDYMLHKLGVHPDDAAKREGTPDKSALHQLSANGLLNPQVWRQAFPTATNWVKEQAKKGTTEENLTPGLLAKGYLRAAEGGASRRSMQMVRALQDYSKDWAKRGKNAVTQFIMNEQHGIPHADPADAKVAQALDGMFQERRDRIENLGVGAFDHWRENYFPQAWKRPNAVQSLIRQMISKRPFEGSRSFTKARVFDDFAEGINAGYEPATWNPIDMAMMKLNEMDKYIAAHEAITNMRDAGIARHVQFGKRLPASMSDWVRIDDRIGVTNKEGNIVTNGNWYAPRDAAKVINNYLSPGLRGNVAYDAIRDFGNDMNQFQLGLSAFHMTTTAINASISDMGTAIQKLFPVAGTASKELFKGNFGEAAKEAKGGLAAGARSISILGSPINAFIAGNRILKEYLSPGTYKNLSALADAVERAGGSAGLNDIYKGQSIGKFKEAIANQNWAKAAVHILPATMEYAAKPIMEWIVPRMKLGAFADMARHTFDQARREGWGDDRVTRELDKNWNSIDGRFGQVNYDNIFVNKVAKDLAFLAVRSAGWTGGTFAELGGGALDSARQVAGMVAGKSPQITSRMAYTMALPITVGYLGSVLYYAYNGHAPTNFHDMFQIPTGEVNQDGRKERVNLPSYMKDVYSFKNDPIRTIANKLHPLGQALTDLIRNADYRNVEIRHPDDPISRQVYDAARYFFKDMIPFSFENAQRMGEAEGKTGAAAFLPTSRRQLAAFAGITEAPSYQTMSPAEKEASDYERRYGGGGGVRTQAAFQKQQLISNLRRGLYTGQMNEDDVYKQLDAGAISGKEARRLLNEKDLSPLERQFKNITDINEALKVWSLADKNEKEKLEPLMISKWKSLNDRSENEQDELRPKFQSFLDYEAAQ